MTYISWNGTQQFIKWLSLKENRIRLGTETKWEYAYRAGTTTPFTFGDTLSTDQAKYDGNYPYSDGPKGIYHKKTSPIASFSPNSFGLYDMHGNVWEWCQDWYDENYYRNSPSIDPQGSSSSSYRVLHGGSWICNVRGPPNATGASMVNASSTKACGLPEVSRSERD